MPIPVEIPAATVVGIGAAITLWYNIYTRWITEKSRDLEAGERNRFEYVRKQMPNLEPKLKSAVQSVKKLEKSPDSGLTSELRENLAELGKLVADIDSIQDAHSGIVESMRKFRDRGVVTLIILGMVFLAFEISAYVPEVLYQSGLAGLGLAYLLIFYVLLGLAPKYREYKRVNKLLVEKKLDAIGVEK